jgi:hypothetical protein
MICDCFGNFVRVSQGTILFVSGRMRDENGREWLHVPDGWIAEVDEAHMFLLLPLLDQTTETTTKTSTHRIEFITENENDHNANSNYNEPQSVRNCHSRLVEIRALQKQLQEMTETMGRLGESIVSCQQSITRLVNGE